MKFGLWVADATLLTPNKTVPTPDDLRHTTTTLRQVMRKVPQRRHGALNPNF